MVHRNEGLRRAEAGRPDAEGFIAPSVGIVEHAQYFTTAPDVLAKTIQLLDNQRLDLPGAVIVWDETIGRRTGSKAVPGAWWASAGSLTMSLVFPLELVQSQAQDATAAIEMIAQPVRESLLAFAPAAAVSLQGAQVLLNGLHLGQVTFKEHAESAVFVLRLHANTDFMRAPRSVRDSCSRLADYIDLSQLPLGSADTLANTLSLVLMRRVPAALGYS